MAGKECPMCGETMRLHVREITERVPGTPQVTTTSVREWICPECDYFEDVEDGEG
jgi:C4-type Zn-finger protein